MKKTMKTFVVLTLLILACVFSVSAAEENKYEYHDSSWYLSEEEAWFFMGFIYDVNPEDIAENEFANVSVDMLTGEYADSPDDERIIKQSFCEIALRQMNNNVDNYDEVSALSSDSITQWLQKQVGDGTLDDYANSTCNGYLDEIKKSMFKGVSMYNLDDDTWNAFENMNTGYKTITSTPKKARNFVDSLKAVFDTLTFTKSTSRSAMYQYTLGYIKSRGLANSTVDGFELCMNHNVMALVNQGLYDWLLNWADEDNQKVLNRWAELMYWLSQDVGGVSFEREKVYGSTESTKEPSVYEPGNMIYEGFCGKNVKYILNSITGDMIIYGWGEMTSKEWRDKDLLKYIRKVTVCDGITNVISSAFSGCKFLDEVYLGVDVVKIGISAFSSCESLRFITIEGDVTEIGGSAFYGCDGLESFALPENVKSIQSSTFYSCSNLKKFVFSDKITSIGEEAFKYCASLSGELVLPDSLTYIGKYAFQKCSSITGDIVIPDKIKSVEAYTFDECSGITGIIVPKSVNSIGKAAFRKTSPVYVELPFVGSERQVYSFNNGVIAHAFGSVEDGDYDENASFMPKTIKSIKITDATRIAYYAFCGCDWIEKIEINEGVVKIDEYAFLGCRSLKQFVIPSSVTQINYRAFRNCTSLEGIIIPDSVISLDTEAFYGCSGMQYLYISKNITHIPNGAFGGCSGLKVDWETLLPENITAIGAYAFSGCKGITGELKIPDSVTAIYYEAFANCVGISDELIIPDKVTLIGDKAFYKCSNITKLTIPDSVSSTTNAQFAYCTSLKEITVPAYLGVSGNASSTSPFVGCNNIEKVTITKGNQNGHMMGYLYSVEDRPWHDSRTVLKEVVIEEGVIQVGDRAFISCTALKNVCLPDSITEIDRLAFDGCKELKELTITNRNCKINSTNSIPTSTTIKAACDSQAYIFAKNNKRGFVSIEHIYTSDVISPTCTAEGYATYTCICGDTYNSDFSDKLAHSYTSEITVQPTHLTEGVMTFTCSCGDEYTDVIGKTAEHTHHITGTVNVTCTEKGYTTYTCECGDTYVSDEVVPIGHTDVNKDGMCDECNHDNTGSCSCNCHKSGFSSFIWKILRFFYKLFKINPVCACGMAHY